MNHCILIIEDTPSPPSQPPEMFSLCCCHFFDATYEAVWRAWRKSSHRAFLNQIFRRQFPEPNPLPLLMRAVNAVRLVAVRFIPRWKRGRWKSLT